MEVYGIERGYAGLLDGEIRLLERRSVGDILQRGGTFLKTARSKEFTTDEGQERAMMMLDTFGISDLVTIGGDGTMRGAIALAKRGIRVMHLPGTIDNDLGYTDETIGFDTAVETVLDAITKIRDTSSSHLRTTIIEVMGRHCGDIALFAGLTGGAENILIPEIEYDINDICRQIVMGRNAGKLHSIIIKAEGANIDTKELAETIEAKTGRETREVVLSYLQRGGSPAMHDRLLATMTAAKAIELIAEDSASKAIGVNIGKIVAVDLFEALDCKREPNMKMYKLIEVLAK
jgi:6-phosphofructokinase 1